MLSNLSNGDSQATRNSAGLCYFCAVATVGTAGCVTKKTFYNTIIKKEMDVKEQIHFSEGNRNSGITLCINHNLNHCTNDTFKSHKEPHQYNIIYTSVMA